MSPALLPPIAVAIPLIAGLLIFHVPEERHGLRTALNLGAALAKLALVVVLLFGVVGGATYEAALNWLPGRDLILRVDALALLFLALSSLLWLLTTVYAIAYLEGGSHRSRFFGFFSLCVAATAGIALAGNLLTFLLFYELLTLATWPLVIHRGTAEARRAGAVYLRYTLSGGVVLLAGIVLLESVTGPVDFAIGAALPAQAGPAVVVAFALMLAGLGVKAALVPLHGWLPRAMVAPAPVSALLHAVAVVKAGAFGIIRLVHDVYGPAYLAAFGGLNVLMGLSVATILWGSWRALSQDDLKRRLAYSTVCQVSYIALGMAVAGPVAVVGGLVHLVHQGLMKITLFFAAGNLAETLEVHRISRMDGVGQRMPLTMGVFTVGALGMIGVPPVAGFVSKWYLGAGAIAVEHPEILGILVLSSLLNAAYFLPILHRAWFRPPRAGEWRDHGRPGRLETHWMLLLPPLITAGTALAAGLFAGSEVSPLSWAQRVAEALGHGHD